MDAETTRTLTIKHGVLLKNDAQAAANRTRFAAQRLTVVNLLSSPGSGKTTLLERTLVDLGPRIPMAVIVGDLATDNDANRLGRTGVPVHQITTGTVCHLDAAMIARACDELSVPDGTLLIIENVGNLVCPASYDLGEAYRVVLMAVTEGEDKPAKYPKIFKTADLLLITKVDLTEAAGFDRPRALQTVHQVAPQAEVIEVSARSGVGLERWYQRLWEWCSDSG